MTSRDRVAPSPFTGPIETETPRGGEQREPNAINAPIAAAARLDRLPIGRFHRRIVGLLAYIFFFELGDLNSFAFAAPAIRAQWGLSIATTSGIISASFVGMFIGAMTGGWLSDRFGRKRALMTTTFFYSGFSLLNAVVWNVPSLYAARLLTGVGLAAMTVVAITYISEMFPATRRGSYQARIMTIGLCGIPATAYVARFLVPAGPWGWRLVFIWGSLALFFPLFARQLEESPRWYESHGDFAEADRVLSRIERQLEAEHGALPAVRHLASNQPATRREGLSALIASGSLGRLALLSAVWVFGTLGFYGFSAWVPTLLAERGFSIVRALERSSAMQIGAIPGAWIAARVSDRWERKSLIAIASLVVATCGVIYGLSSNDVIIVIFGFLVAMTQHVFTPLLYAYTPECFPTQARSTGAGLSYGVGRVVNAFGPLVVAYLFQAHGYASVFVYIAACWAMVALLVTTLGPGTMHKQLT